MHYFNDKGYIILSLGIFISLTAQPLYCYNARNYNGEVPESVEKKIVDPCDGIEKMCCSSTDDLYQLKSNGILKELPSGGSIIEVDQRSKPFKLPHTLKNLPQKSWTKQDKIWFNISYTPWLDDDECEKFRIVFSTKKFLPLIGLASFPRSGNTWLRYLIEGATGIFTGSFYNSGCMVSQGYFGDGVPVYSGTTILIKTHGYFNTPVTNMRDQQSKPNDTEWMMEVTRGTGIVLIRNPFRVLYSFRNYNVMGLWGHADASKFTGPEWDEHINISIQLWERFYLEWIKNGKHIMVMYYEELTKKDNLETSILQITNFMNFTIQKERLSCVSKHRKGKFYQNQKCIPRTQKEICDRIEFIYSNKQIKFINSAIRKVRKAIRKRGLDDSHMRTYKDTNIKLTYCLDD